MITYVPTDFGWDWGELAEMLDIPTRYLDEDEDQGLNRISCKLYDLARDSAYTNAICPYYWPVRAWLVALIARKSYYCADGPIFQGLLEVEEQFTFFKMLALLLPAAWV